jgi:hypothetical protein
MTMNDAADYHPQYIEDSQFVVLRIADYENLLQWYSEPAKVYRFPPQCLKDAAGTQTHVVLIEDEFKELLVNLPSSEFIFSIEMPNKAVRAWGMLHLPDKAMTVFRGSLVGDVVDSLQEPYRRLRRRLVEENTIGTLVCQEAFLANYTFDNPSTAARVVTGDSFDGYIVWKKNGKSLKELGHRPER